MVRHTQLAGKEVPVSFGNAALIRFEEETGISILNLGTTPLNYKNSLILIYEGLRDGHRKDKKDFTMTFDDLCDYLDEDAEALVRIMDLLNKAMPVSDEKKTKAKPIKK
jgi:hypothetical protein